MAETSRTASSSSSRATLRETEGLAASLRDNREEVLRWKDENPLRLVAAALLDMERRETNRGRASKKNLSDKLVPVVIAPEEWDNWWKVVQPALRDSKDFDYEQRGGTKPSRTAPSEIAIVTLGELSAATRKTRGGKTAWLDWLVSGDDVPMPKSPLRMNEDLAKGLRELDAARVPTTVSKLCGEIEKRAFGASKSRKASSGAWVKVFSAVLARWSELPTNPNASTHKTVSLTARLSGVSELEKSDWENLSESLANYTSVNVGNTEEIANAIIVSSRTAPRETTALLEQIHRLMGESARINLWQKLITSGIGQGNDWLNNRWRNMPSDSEKAEVMASLLMSARDADSIGDLDSLLSDMWNMADDLRAHLFNPILTGWILHWEMMPKVKRVLQKFAEEIGNDESQAPESAADSSYENPIMRQWKEIVKAASQNEIGRLRAEHQREIAEKDRLISVAESETERVDKGKTYFQEKLREAASAASLRFNRDAIDMLGEWLWDLSESSLASHPEIRNVEDKISSTLIALGAKPFGEIGKVVPFDPSLHEANPSPPAGSPVKIAAPGVSYFRDVDAPYTIVKIKVKVE